MGKKKTNKQKKKEKQKNKTKQNKTKQKNGMQLFASLSCTYLSLMDLQVIQLR